MRQAMASAEVGDDVFGEDPTVRRLEEEAAELLGFSGGLFVPTGTMANQIAVALLTRPGQEVIGEEGCHIFNFEMAAMAALSGTFPRPLKGADGVLDPAAVREAIRPDLSFFPQTGLVVMENTHNLAGGTVMPLDTQEAILSVAREQALPVHLDGARIFNAAVALDRPPAALASGCNTAMFCLSKGLGAPVGSVLVGEAAAMLEARRIRKRLGGGMRQVGVLAAAGLVALGNRKRLSEDHDNARVLAESIEAIDGCTCSWGGTNIVMMELPEPQAESTLRALAAEGVAAFPFGPHRIRFVTHLDVDRDGVERAGEVLARILTRAS